MKDDLSSSVGAVMDLLGDLLLFPAKSKSYNLNIDQGNLSPTTKSSKS